jgi:hypothetical protein
MNKQHRFEISLITTLKLSTSPKSKNSLQIIFNLLLTLKPYYVDFLSDFPYLCKVRKYKHFRWTINEETEYRYLVHQFEAKVKSAYKLMHTFPVPG